MTAPVSVNNTNSTAYVQPVGAYTLHGSNRFEPGNFIVNPPSSFYKYSVYDELELGKDRYKEILNSIQSKSALKQQKSTKRRTVFSKILKLALAAAAGILIYKNRNTLKNVFQNLWNRISKKS